MDRQFLIISIFLCLCDHIESQSLPLCPGLENVMTTCEIRPGEFRCTEGHKCSKGKTCCRYGCGKQSCYNPDAPALCYLKKDPGPCEAAQTKYFYNPLTQKCETFTYGGCLGNKNNFKTMDDCQKTCIKIVKPPKNPCKLDKPLENVFCGRGPTREDCPEGYKCKISPVDKYAVCCATHICYLPKKPGPCRGSFVRWFFNSKTKMCEQFIYGGCQGNANSFTTEQECTQVCSDFVNPCKIGKPLKNVFCGRGPGRKDCPKGHKCVISPVDKYAVCCATDICFLPSETGPCKAAFTRWFFNSKTRKCEQFIYGGCQGNKNNFESFKDCNVTCRKFKSGCSGQGKG